MRWGYIFVCLFVRLFFPTLSPLSFTCAVVYFLVLFSCARTHTHTQTHSIFLTFHLVFSTLFYLPCRWFCVYTQLKYITHIGIIITLISTVVLLLFFFVFFVSLAFTYIRRRCRCRCCVYTCARWSTTIVLSTPNWTQQRVYMYIRWYVYISTFVSLTTPHTQSQLWLYFSLCVAE